MKVNPKYKTVNAQAQIRHENSIWNYYRKLISLRKEYQIITGGKYQLSDISSDKIWAYKRIMKNRELIVLANFTAEVVPCSYENK